MSLTLNGWRRVGIVAASLYLLAIIAVAFTEYSSKSAGFFVFQSIPVGTVVAGNKVTLPDGKVITITEEEEFKMRLRNERGIPSQEIGQPLLPWQIDWSELSSVPKITEISWQRLGLFALLVPLIIWFLAEAVVLTASWVRRGFAAGAPRDS